MKLYMYSHTLLCTFPQMLLKRMCGRKLLFLYFILGISVLLISSVTFRSYKYEAGLAPVLQTTPPVKLTKLRSTSISERLTDQYNHFNISATVLLAINAIVQADTRSIYPTGSLLNVTCRQQNRSGTVEDILCMERPGFLDDYKNPCWRKQHGRLLCLPYFQVIGTDKCGSTDLFDRIAKHPDVDRNSGSLQKETQWWSWKRYGHWLRNPYPRKESFLDYLNYFRNASLHIESVTDAKGVHYRITGDGTPMDFWDQSGWVSIPQNQGLKYPHFLTPHLIRHINPNVKLLLILRDPIERLFSDYFFLKLGPLTTEAFHRHVVRSIYLLHHCVKQSSLRTCLYNRQLHIRLIARLHLGFYSVFVREWLNVFPREQILILRTEDYSKQTKKHIKSVFQYLELRELPDQELDKIASSARKYVTKKKKDIGSMKQETRVILQELYRSFNYKLAELLNDDRFLWSER